MEDLQARIDCLLKENVELKMQVADRDDKLKEAEALTATTFEEKVWAQEEREKVVTMARKVHAFVGNPGDVVTKARVYDKSMKKPEVVPASKVLRVLIGYSGKMEKLLEELRTFFQYGEWRKEAGPSERRLEPELVLVSRPKPVPQLAPTLAAPSTKGASVPTPQPEAPKAQPKVVATPGIADPTPQESIPDSLNMDDLVSLHQWATEGLQEMATFITGSQGPTALVVRTTPGSITRSQRRGPGSVQTNLFGGTRDDPAAGLCQWVKEQQVRHEEQVEKISSSSESEEETVPSDRNSSEGEDEDSPLASTHRLVIWSTPKRPISRPKQKAYKSKGSGLGSSSQKRSKGQN